MNTLQIIAVIREVQRQNNERNIPATSPLGMRVEDVIALVDYIERLEAVVREADEIRGWLPAFPAHESSQKADMDTYDAARSRVNLPESPESSATNGTERKETKP